MPPVRTVLASGAGLMALWAAADALACSVGRPPVLYSWTARSVPSNARVWVAAQPEWARALLCRGDEACQPEAELALRTAPTRGQRRADVPTRVLESRSAAVTTLQLLPQQPLAPGRYELWVRDRARRLAPRLVKVLTSSGQLDETPPTWSAGIARAWRYAPPKRTGGTITIDMCPSALVSIELAGLAQDSGGPVAYAVWVHRQDGSINPEPELVQVPYQRTLTFGDVEYPEEGDFIWPEGASSVRFSVRAVDLAGNYSEAHSVTVQP